MHFDTSDLHKVHDHRIVWTYSDTARALQCSVWLVQKLVQQDRIPFAKIGRLVRFSPARVAEWLARGANR